MPTEAPQTPPDEQVIRDALRRVIDPEVGMNIVDLGLVYRIQPDPQRVVVEMTMTSPACPMGDLVVDDVRAELKRILPADCQAEVRLVWEPPWQPSMMSGRSKAHFGWQAGGNES